MSLSALAIALIAGGAAAAGTGLGHGIAALSGGAFAQRRMRKEMTRQAEAEMARGQREGWGYSEARKREMVAGQMRAYDQASAVDRTDQLRQTAVQGIGRGGQVDANRAQMARARGEMAAQTKSAVRQESRAAGQQRKADVRNLYMQAHGMNVAAQERGAAALSSTLSKGVDVGVAAYGDERQRETDEAIAASGAQVARNNIGSNVGRYYPR